MSAQERLLNNLRSIEPRSASAMEASGSLLSEVSTMKDVAAIYVRVSRDKSKTKEGRKSRFDIVSPETQKESGQHYAAAQQWTVPEEYVIEDLDKSGYRISYKKRPGLMRLLRLAEERKITRVIVYKLARLSRRLKEFLEIVDELERHGCAVVSVTEQIDTSTPAGRLIRNIMASFAQYVSEDLSGTIADIRLTMAGQGRHPGGWAAYGLMWHEKVLVRNPETWDNLYTIFELCAQGNGVGAIWEYLFQKRIVSPTGNAMWDKSQLRAILRNPIYISQLNYDGERYDIEMDQAARIPREMWLAAQKTLDRFAKGSKRADSTPHLLSGFIWCTFDHAKYDGAVLRGLPRFAYEISINAGRRRYACRVKRRMSARNSKCPHLILDGETLEPALIAYLFSLARDSQLMAEVERAARTVIPQDLAPLEHRRKEIIAEIGQIVEWTKELFDMYHRQRTIVLEQFTAQNQEYVAHIESLKQELADLEEKLTLAQCADTEFSAYRTALSSLEMSWNELDPHERRLALRTVLKEVLVFPDHLTADFYHHKVRIVPTEIRREVMYFDPVRLITSEKQESQAS